MKYSKAFLVSAALSISNPATVSAATFTFTQGGFSEGATVDGFFVGEDRNNDGLISGPATSVLPNEMTSFLLHSLAIVSCRRSR